MLKLVGVPASPGIAVGAAHFLGGRVDVHERRIFPEEVPAELARFEDARARADEQLRHVQEQIAGSAGDAGQHGILEAHRMMLADARFVDDVRATIRRDHVSAEWAVRRALDAIQEVFSRIEDPFFRDRGRDMDLVGDRVLRNLLGMVPPGQVAVPSGAVVFAHDLSPADVTQIARSGIGGLFTEGGGRTSHTAVVARALGLPLVVGVQGLQHLRSGMIVIVDGARGEIIVEPDDDARERYAARAARALAREQGFAVGREGLARTACGERVEIGANVELLEEVPAAVDRGAESIGLFRTEFLYLEQTFLPTEAEQYDHIVGALAALGGRTATFRTLDLGGDKMPLAVRIPAGSNPAMGLRSIRYSLHQRDVFRAQLRALYRAAATGPLRILFPMVSGLAELRAARAICDEVCADLAREGKPHDAKAAIGVMIETPAAVFIADALAAECDFLSIGTNDLIQYSLAANREDEHVGYLYRPLHPAILRALRQIVEAGRRTGKPIYMCGDMAGDPLSAWVLLGLGLRGLSMAPRQIPILKAIVRETRLADAQALVARIMAMATEGEIEAAVTAEMHRRFPHAFEDLEEGAAA